MEIPIMLEEREQGRLLIRQEGPYTVFEGRCADPGGVLRLSVYGEGGEGYLGVMIPEGEGLHIRKRLSRSAMRTFPDTLRYAAPAGETPPGRTEKASEETPPETAEGQETQEAEPPPAEDGPESAELLWYQSVDGSLFTTWQGKRYRAIPMTAHGLPERQILERRSIQGVDYAVFELGYAGA